MTFYVDDKVTSFVTATAASPSPVPSVPPVTQIPWWVWVGLGVVAGLAVGVGVLAASK